MNANLVTIELELSLFAFAYTDAIEFSRYRGKNTISHETIDVCLPFHEVTLSYDLNHQLSAMLTDNMNRIDSQLQ